MMSEIGGRAREITTRVERFQARKLEPLNLLLTLRMNWVTDGPPMVFILSQLVFTWMSDCFSQDLEPRLDLVAQVESLSFSVRDDCCSMTRICCADRCADHNKTRLITGWKAVLWNGVSIETG